MQLLLPYMYVKKAFTVSFPGRNMNFDNFLCLILVISQTAFIVALLSGLFSIKTSAIREHSVVTVPIPSFESPSRTNRHDNSRQRRRRTETDRNDGPPSYTELVSHANWLHILQWIYQQWMLLFNCENLVIVGLLWFQTLGSDYSKV